MHRIEEIDTNGKFLLLPQTRVSFSLALRRLFGPEDWLGFPCLKLKFNIQPPVVGTPGMCPVS